MSARLAWLAFALTLAMTIATSVLALFNHADTGNLSYSVIGISWAVVGAVVASRRPANPVGWLFLGGVLLSSLRTLTAEYAVYGMVTHPGAVPLRGAMAGLSNAIEVIGPVLIFILVPLYFPNGRPVSRRWGVVAWLALGFLPVMTALEAVSVGEAVDGSGIPNPWGVEALRPVTEVLEPVGFVYYIGLIFVSAASVVVRYGRSRGEERQQIKWLAFAAALIPVWFVTNTPVERAFPALFVVLDALVISGVPLAAGIAILRYRLYDIDVIINRTLVYVALTAALVALYFGGIVVFQRVFVVLTGGESTLAVVASTLAIAALFNPLRQRIQGFIDRRFYRRKYDARKTLEGFSAKLREETDLNELSAELLGVARETVQPSHASLWLRPPSLRERSRDV